MSFDLAFNLFLRHHLSNPVFDVLFVALTKLGDIGIIWIITSIICLFFKRTRYIGLCVLVSLILALTISTGIKHLVGRLRPFQDYGMKLLISAPSGSSFPSSHASVSVAAAGAYLITAKEKPESYFRWPLVIVALLIAFSRLYLFVHYPSDVLAGILVGAFSALLSVYCLGKIKERGGLEFLEIPGRDKKKL